MSQTTDTDTEVKDTTTKKAKWTFKGGTTLSGSQSNFTNWNAGGQNSL
jgi:predicted ribonuclease toxin of YeeF-YezG toxin-antitoxin module